PELARELAADLPPAEELSPAQLRASVQRFLAGAQPLECAVYALRRCVEEHAARLELLEPAQRAVLERRLLARESWRAAARAAGLAGVPAAMRAVRPAVRRLLEE